MDSGLNCPFGTSQAVPASTDARWHRKGIPVTESDNLSALRETQADHGHMLVDLTDRLDRLDTWLHIVRKDVQEGFSEARLRSIRTDDRLGKLDEGIVKITNLLAAGRAEPATA